MAIRLVDHRQECGMKRNVHRRNDPTVQRQRIDLTEHWCCVMVVWSVFLCHHSAAAYSLFTSNEIPFHANESLLPPVRECSNDSACTWNSEPIDDRDPSSMLCVDSTCSCAPNHKPKWKMTESSANGNFECEPFLCTLGDDECQEYDAHRICQVSTGQCVCRANFIEDVNNGRKCTPPTVNIPAYVKHPRKYLNKNVISYRENIEQVGNAGPDKVWVQYLLFASFFMGQVVITANYVIVRRHRMIKKILQQKESTTEQI